MESLQQLFSQKFQQQEIFHIIKSLTYFEDAELYPNPNIFDKKTTWEMVKKRIFKAVQELT